MLPIDVDKAEIIRMYDEALDAFKRGDIEAVLSHWEDDGAYMWPAVSPAIGKQEIRMTYAAFFARWTAEEVFFRHELEVSGDLAFSRFGTELTLYPKTGGPSTKMTLQGIHIYRRKPSGWKFKVVIAIGVGENS
jgi:ketosteroid isomerase-like protein